jgi:hypothetical protein
LGSQLRRNRDIFPKVQFLLRGAVLQQEQISLLHSKALFADASRALAEHDGGRNRWVAVGEPLTVSDPFSQAFLFLGPSRQPSVQVDSG